MIDLTEMALQLESIGNMTKSNAKQPKRHSRRKVDNTPEAVFEAFVACPRCSFFLAGYRLIHTDYEAAVGKSHGNVLDLTWNAATRNLVQKSYGCRIPFDAIHYEGVCKDCRRTFAYKAPATRRTNESFQIEIK